MASPCAFLLAGYAPSDMNVSVDRACVRSCPASSNATRSWSGQAAPFLTARTITSASNSLRQLKFPALKDEDSKKPATRTGRPRRLYRRMRSWLPCTYQSFTDLPMHHPDLSCDTLLLSAQQGYWDLIEGASLLLRDRRLPKLG